MTRLTCWAPGPDGYRCGRENHVLDPETPHRWRTTTWPQRVYRQDEDGQVYLGFYTSPYAFVWDGLAAFIEVSLGGMGEPITATIEAPDLSASRNTATAMVEQFHLACMTYIEEGEMD